MSLYLNSGVPDVFSKSLLKTDASKRDTLASSFFGIFKNIQRNWQTVFDNYKNVLKDGMQVFLQEIL